MLKIWHKTSPTPSKSLRDKTREVAIVEFDQRVVVMLEWLVEGFGGVSDQCS
jgi:hypothetical protein